MASIECGISRFVMRELKKAFPSGNWDPVVARLWEGRVMAVMFLTAWMLREVSPQLSGNYYVFSGVGDHPRRHSRTRIDTRKGMRRRITRAGIAKIIEARNPIYENRVDAQAGKPPNAAPDPDERLDIPLIASKPLRPKKANQEYVLIPTSWRDRQRYHSQIHPTPTYRLTETNYPQMSALTELGKLILNKHQSFENIVRPEIEACWETLDTYLQRQHRDTKESYRSGIERLEKAMEEDSPIRRTACALYLASSLTRLWPSSWVIICPKAIHTFKRMSLPGDS